MGGMFFEENVQGCLGALFGEWNFLAGRGVIFYSGLGELSRMHVHIPMQDYKSVYYEQTDSC